MSQAPDRADLHKHLDFIQNVIARLANNSFLMKGWTLTVSGAFFGFAAKDSAPGVAAVGLLPAAVFWGLDAYYLRQERLFRRFYDLVARSPEQVEAFSMNALIVRDEVRSWFRTLFSRTIWPFHGAIAVVGSIVVLATS